MSMTIDDILDHHASDLELLAAPHPGGISYIATVDGRPVHVFVTVSVHGGTRRKALILLLTATEFRQFRRRTDTARRTCTPAPQTCSAAPPAASPEPAKRREEIGRAHV